MARFAHGDQSDVDLPIDEVASPPVAPSSAVPDESPLPNQPATRPIGSSISDLGATFNGMTRAPTDASPQGGLDPGGQVANSVAHYTNDLTTVQNNLLAELNAGQFSGATLGHVQAILSDLTSAISAANATVSAAGSLASAASAQTLRASQVSMINAVSTDPALANPAPETPQPAGTAADAKPHNLAEIGEMFDDVASQILGGVNDGNRAQITDDINTVISDIQALMAADPKLFDGMTGVHADKIVQQLELELVYINDPGVSVAAAQASTDNILDIIELIHGDANLAGMSTQDGIGGTSPLADAARPDPIHLDNAAETIFAANLIAQSNSLGKQAVELVGSHDAEAIAALIADLKAFEKSVTDVDAAQGRTLGGEIAAMIKGLQTGNANLVTAAADQMHGNAGDLGGNHVPATGGTYNTDGVTVAEVLATPTAAVETPAATAVGVEQIAIATADLAPAVADHDHSAPELAHLHHMWG